MWLLFSSNKIYSVFAFKRDSQTDVLQRLFFFVLQLMTSFMVQRPKENSTRSFIQITISTNKLGFF